MTTSQPSSNHIHAPESMSAALLYGIRDIRLETIPVPAPGPGEVLLKLASVGVCGSDVHYYVDGRIGDAIVEEPIIMGHEFSGVIVTLGRDVAGLEVGQLVAVEPAINCGHCEMCLAGHPNLCADVRFCGTPPINGVFTEYAVMPAHNCFPMPSGMTAVEGAMLEPLGVAIHTVDLSHLRVGQTIAILGAGPIGLLIAAVAKAAGASRIYMTEPEAHRRAFALDYIADEVFDPQTQDVVAEVLRATDGRGVDVSFEAAGAQDTPQQGAEMVRLGGTLVLCGIPGSEDTLTLKASLIRRKGLTIKMVRRMKHAYPRAILMLESGMIDVNPIVSHLVSLQNIQDTFEMVAAYKDGVLRAVVQME